MPALALPFFILIAVLALALVLMFAVLYGVIGAATVLDLIRRPFRSSD